MPPDIVPGAAPAAAPASVSPAPAPILTPEAKTPEPLATPETKEDAGEFARRFADLNRSAKKQLLEQQKLAAERKAFQEERAAAEKEREEYRRYSEAKSKVKTDKTAAMELLQSMDLTYDDLTAMILNDNQLTDSQKIASLEKRDKEREEAAARAKAEAEEASKSAAEKAQAEERTRVETEFRAGLKDYVAERKSEYELVHATEDGLDQVYEVIVAFYEEKGEFPEWLVDAALKEVEEHLTEKYKPLLSLGKFSPPPAAGTSNAAGKPGQERAAPPFTLTNAATAAPAETRPDYLPDDESIARAAAVLKWK